MAVIAYGLDRKGDGERNMLISDMGNVLVKIEDGIRGVRTDVEVLREDQVQVRIAQVF